MDNRQRIVYNVGALFAGIAANRAQVALNYIEEFGNRLWGSNFGSTVMSTASGAAQSAASAAFSVASTVSGAVSSHVVSELTHNLQLSLNPNQLWIPLSDPRSILEGTLNIFHSTTPLTSYAIQLSATNTAQLALNVLRLTTQVALLGSAANLIGSGIAGGVGAVAKETVKKTVGKAYNLTKRTYERVRGSVGGNGKDNGGDGRSSINVNKPTESDIYSKDENEEDRKKKKNEEMEALLRKQLEQNTQELIGVMENIRTMPSQEKGAFADALKQQLDAKQIDESMYRFHMNNLEGKTNTANILDNLSLIQQKTSENVKSYVRPSIQEEIDNWFVEQLGEPTSINKETQSLNQETMGRRGQAPEYTNDDLDAQEKRARHQRSKKTNTPVEPSPEVKTETDLNVLQLNAAFSDADPIGQKPGDLLQPAGLPQTEALQKQMMGDPQPNIMRPVENTLNQIANQIVVDSKNSLGLTSITAVNGEPETSGAQAVGLNFQGSEVTRSIGEGRSIVTNALKKRLSRCPADRKWWDTNDNLAFIDENVEEKMLEILKNGELTEKEKARNEAGVADVLRDFPQYRLWTSQGSANLLTRPSPSKRMRSM